MRKKTVVKATKKKSSSGKKSNSSRSFGFKALIFFLKAGVAALLLAFLLFLIVYVGFTGSVPSSDELQKIKNPISTEVFAADGELLGRYYIENRSNIRFEDISKNVIDALIATEDSRFYHHRGIDELALLRVFFKSIILQDRSSGGGSTLSQQIAKNLFPRKSLGAFSMPVNKLRESIIAYRLERLYTKDEILSLYLNTVPFAENVFGIGVASERFFSKPTSKLEIHEAATLVGMLKANNFYNPRKNPERAIERRNVVIDQMHKYGYITKEEEELYKSKELEIKYNPITYNEGPAPYLIEKIRPIIQKWCKENLKEDKTYYNLYTDGLKIRTTINFDMQIAAEKAVSEQMKRLQKLFDEHWNSKNPWGNDESVVFRAMKRSERYKNLKKSGINDEQIKTIFNSPKLITLYTADGLKQKEITPLDSIRHFLKVLNAGFMAMNPHNGELKAYIGGVDFKFFKYDHTISKRQVGSTFKPIVYLSALETGISPSTYFANERKVYSDYQDWSPENSHDDYNGFYSMEGALSKSINTIAVDVLMQSGINNTIELANRMGIESELPEYPSLALGAASVSLEEMVCVYSEFVNGGRKIKPYYIKSFEDNSGKILMEFENIQEDLQVASAENCHIITQMLKSAIDNGTGRAIRTVWGIDSEFAGKTGTTQDQADGWFIGMSPELVAGAWVGGEDPSISFRTLSSGAGGQTALPIVGQFFSQVFQSSKFKNLRYSSFTMPNEESQYLMAVLPYRELLEVDKKGFDIGRIFGKKEVSADTEMKIPENKVADKTEEKTQTEQTDNKKPFWENMKEIFRKKRNQ